MILFVRFLCQVVGRMTPPSRGVNWPRRYAPHYTPRSKGTDPAITGEPPEEPDPRRISAVGPQ